MAKSVKENPSKVSKSVKSSSSKPVASKAAEKSAQKQVAPKTAVKQAPKAKSVSISEDAIRRKAYEIYLKNGCQQNSDLQNWLLAKAELSKKK